MGILDLLQAAVIPAASARAGYLSGQSEEEDKNRELDRRTLLDRMEQNLKQSQIDENASRGKYYDSLAGSEGVEYKLGADGQYYAVPKKVARGSIGATAPSTSPSASPASSSGAAPTDALSTSPTSLIEKMREQMGLRSTADAAAPPSAPAGLIADPNASLIDRMSATLAKPSAAATPMGQPTGIAAPPPRAIAPPRIDPLSAAGITADSAKAANRQLARVDNPTPRAARQAAPMSPATTERYLQKVADDAVQAAGGDVRAAATAVMNDPAGELAYSKGLSTRHFDAAAQRFKTKQTAATDRHAESADRLGVNPDGSPIQPPAKPGTAKSPPPNSPTAAPATGKPGDIDLGAEGAGAVIDPAMRADPQVQAVLGLLKNKKATLNDVDRSRLSAEQKAAVKKLFVGGTDE